jgi:hypothetical protein
VAEVFFRLNKFTLVYFSFPKKPGTALLDYSSAYSSSSSLFTIGFRELILCQTSSYLGSSHGVLIVKRLVGTYESRIGSRILSCFHLNSLFTWKTRASSIAPSLLKQLLFYKLLRVVPLPQSPLPVLCGSTVCYYPRRLCWNAVVKGGYIIHTTQPPSTPLVIVFGMAAPPRGRYARVKR